MKRRAFLGAVAAAPVAIPQMAGEMSKPSAFYGANVGYADAPQQDPEWHARQIANARQALSQIDDAPDDVFGMMLKGYGDPSIECLKSVSPAMKRQMTHAVEMRRARERAKQNLQERLDGLLGNPLSKWQELRRIL